LDKLEKLLFSEGSMKESDFKLFIKGLKQLLNLSKQQKGSALEFVEATVSQLLSKIKNCE